MNPMPTPVLFIPALLCDEAMYRDVIADLGGAIQAQVMLSPKPDLADSVADILSRAPETFVLAGTSYGGSLALEIALAAPLRVKALWLMGCNAAAPQPGGPDLAAALASDPVRVMDQLSGLVVRKDATAAAATFKEMAQRVGGPAGAAQARAAATRLGAIERLGTLAMPTLLVWGADDALSPLSCGQALAHGIPHAHLEVLEGCGHLPTLEKPVECAALFRALLLQVTSTGG
ncbi:MAG: alpha/beta hydrolase [Rhodoferax sp.]|nr:alpha/beta hydrolase [Rhodoferax sp.]